MLAPLLSYKIISVLSCFNVCLCVIIKTERRVSVVLFFHVLVADGRCGKEWKQQATVRSVLPSELLG